MKKVSSYAVMAAVILLGSAAAFAGAIHFKNGDVIENVVIVDLSPTEVKYQVGESGVVFTVSRDDVLWVVYDYAASEPETQTRTLLRRLYAGYSTRGVGVSWYRIYPHIDGDSPMTLGLSMGAAWNTLIDMSLETRWTFPLFGVQNSSISVGASTTWGIAGAEPIALYGGYQYDRWLFELGSSVGGRYGDWGSSFFIRTGMEYSRQIEMKEREERNRDSNRPRIFRFGFELLNYSMWLGDAGFPGFDEPPVSVGLGFFARIGPEPIYFTTGFYGRYDSFNEKGVVTQDLILYGIPLGSIDLLDAEMNILSFEIPLLINYGSRQVRFVGGVLFDLFQWGNLNLFTSEELPFIGGQRLELDGVENTLWNAIPTRNMYWVLGLDLDIFRYWGVGAKFLIHNHSFGTYDESFGVEPNQFQLRFSTYFVF